MENFKNEYMQLRRSFRFDQYAAITANMSGGGPLRPLLARLGAGLVRSFAAADVKLEAGGVLSKIQQDVVPEPIGDGECLSTRGGWR